jgi:hypothetical protein
MNKNNILESLIIIVATVTSVVTMAVCTISGCTTTQNPQTIDSAPEVSKDLSYFTDLGPDSGDEVRNSDVAYTFQVFMLDDAGTATDIIMLKPDVKETK